MLTARRPFFNHESSVCPIFIPKPSQAMITSEQKHNALEKLLQSEEFLHSTTGKELLRYLVNAAIKGVFPKETTIALEVFGRKNFNPAEDSIVRSNVHNIRKKLDSYYLKEGQDDPVRIVIHKGQYRVDFIKAGKHAARLKPVQRFSLHTAVLKYSTIVVISLLVITALYFCLKYQALQRIVFPIAKDDPIWSSFLQSDKPTLIVFGDYYLIVEHRKDLNRSQEIRDYQVDSYEDLKEYRALTKNPDVYRPHFNMLPHHTEQNLFDLLPLFSSMRERVNHTVSSRLTWQEIKENNVIYAGKIKNLRLLRQFTTNLWIRNQKDSHVINIVDDKGDTLDTFLRYRAIESLNPDEFLTKNYYNRDYAAIIKAPGPDDNTVLIFMGIGYISLVETVKMLTGKQSLAAMEEKIGRDYEEIPPYFEMIVEVSGFRRTGLRWDVKFFREIDPNAVLNNLGEE